MEGTSISLAIARAAYSAALGNSALNYGLLAICCGQLAIVVALWRIAQVLNQIAKNGTPPQ